MADLRPVYVAGDGDVKGPASSSNNFLPLFADTTGKLLKSSGTGVTTQGLAILDDNTPAEQRNTIGLNQVNNTSDINKPVSTAQQTALNSKQDKLLYTPVQQGGGIGQGTNKVYIGWGSTTSKLKVTVDSTDLGNVIFDGNTATESAVGVAKIATGDQVNAGLDDTSIVTPKKMKAAAYIIEKITGENCQQAGFTAGGTLPYMKKADGTVIALAARANTVLEGSTNVPDVAAGSSDERIANTRFVTKAIAANPAIGVSQTWQVVTASRAINTTYTNTTDRPIMVSVRSAVDDGYSQLTVGGIVLAASGTSGGGYAGNHNTVSAIVPGGTSYSYQGSAIALWAELR